MMSFREITILLKIRRTDTSVCHWRCIYRCRGIIAIVVAITARAAHVSISTTANSSAAIRSSLSLSGLSCSLGCVVYTVQIQLRTALLVAIRHAVHFILIEILDFCAISPDFCLVIANQSEKEFSFGVFIIRTKHHIYVLIFSCLIKS